MLVKKNIVLGLLLSALLGPLGYTYVSVAGGLTVTVLVIVCLLVSPVIGFILALVFWGMVIVWTPFAIAKFNRKLIVQAELLAAAGSDKVSSATAEPPVQQETSKVDEKDSWEKLVLPVFSFAVIVILGYLMSQAIYLVVFE